MVIFALTFFNEKQIPHRQTQNRCSLTDQPQEGKLYVSIYIHSSFRHDSSKAQPLAWPVTLSVAGGINHISNECL